MNESNISLFKKIKQGLIDKTGAKPKLPTNIRGIHEETLEVYKIPLEFLYYNDSNGRIASEITRLEKKLEPCYTFINDSYNERIEKLIYEANKSSLDKTKKSIESKGQQVFGYVLDDGRVIDGNRRFTALRKIQKNTGKTQYFEAVILPFSYNKKVDRTKVKQLELAIQMGIEKKQDYDNVDAAVDVYQTINVEKLLSISDYANEANKSTKLIQKQLGAALLIRKFLEFINAEPNAYYIIKDTGVYSLFEESSSNLNKSFPKGGPSLEKAIEKLFVFILLQMHSGTSTRAYAGRDFFKNIIDSKENDIKFEKDTEEAVDNLRDRLEEEPLTSTPKLKLKLDESIDSLRKINYTYNKIVDKQKRNANVESFISNISNVADTFDEMRDGGGLPNKLKFNQFNEYQLKKIREYLIKINNDVEGLIDIYDDEI